MSAYDELAPHYRQYALERSAYLEAVDRYIIDHTARPVGSLLDVGAGDGVRGLALARRLGARRIVFCEPSSEMASRCQALQAGEVWQTGAAELPLDGQRFDVILCLWNVLGHIGDDRGRVTALARIKALLEPSRGTLFFDVNNRHNAAAYGQPRVLMRRLLDFVLPDPGRGDALFTWRVGGKEIPARGHLFTPAEVARLVREAGLEVTHRVAVDYANGKYSAVPWCGQLLYQAGTRA